MKYSDLNLHLNKNVNTISIQPGIDINILKYLPIEDKNDLIQLALQNSEENGIYNLLKLDMYFKVYTILSYTDLEFTDEEKENPTLIYDYLNSNGILDCIINSITKEEWAYLTDKLNSTLTMKVTYRNTITSVLNSFIENLPGNAKAAKDIIENFNPEQFMNVISFAQAANGNRPI